MILLNGLFWSAQHHYIGTPYYMMFTVVCITICVLQGIKNATALQSVVSEHRMILKNDIFAIDQALSEQVLGDLGEPEEATRRTTPIKPPTRDGGGGMKGPPLTAPMSPFRRDNRKKVASFREIEESRRALEASKRLLKAADDLIGYQEEAHDPVTVMGVPATDGVYNSTIGILLTFAVLAVEGYSGGGLSYSVTGWSHY